MLEKNKFYGKGREKIMGRFPKRKGMDTKISEEFYDSFKVKKDKKIKRKERRQSDDLRSIRSIEDAEEWEEDEKEDKY